MNRKLPISLCFFLVLLRLAIGWHFFYEGWKKVENHYTYTPNESKYWSSKPFLQQSKGPLAKYILAIVGDPDQQALDRLTLKDGKVSDALQQHWNGYVARFTAHHELDDAQKAQAEELKNDALEKAQLWLSGVEPTAWAVLPATSGSSEEIVAAKLQGFASDPSTIYQVPKNLYYRDENVETNVPQRVGDLRSQIEDIRSIESKEHYVFGSPIRPDLPALKSEKNNLRKQLTDDLDGFLTRRLEKIPLKGPQTTTVRGPVPPEREWIVQMSDRYLPYVLTGFGIALFMGIFTRLAAFLAAGFLLTIYVTIPAFPWIDVPRQESEYLFINKNIIELLALMVLTTVPTGRWFGLDAILQHLNPFGRKKKDDESPEGAKPTPKEEPKASPQSPLESPKDAVSPPIGREPERKSGEGDGIQT